MARTNLFVFENKKFRWKRDDEICVRRSTGVSPLTRSGARASILDTTECRVPILQRPRRQEGTKLLFSVVIPSAGRKATAVEGSAVAFSLNLQNPGTPCLTSEKWGASNPTRSSTKRPLPLARKTTSYQPCRLQRLICFCCGPAPHHRHRHRRHLYRLRLPHRQPHQRAQTPLHARRPQSCHPRSRRQNCPPRSSRNH